MEDGAPSRLINSQELADWLGLSRKGLYHALDAGQVPTPLKIGNRLRWRIEVIEDWLDALVQQETNFRGGT